MTRQMMWIGTLATILLFITLGIALLREESRQTAAAEEQRVAAVTAGAELFATNCVTCHGADGTGIAANPPLNSVAVREMDADLLYKTIERGRYATTMPAFHVEEGGVLSNREIEEIVTLLHYGSWDFVETRVAELGLTPPELVVVEVPEETLLAVQALPDGDLLSQGITFFAENCAVCHGANGEGTAVAPAINTVDVRTRYDETSLARVITEGVPGTVMAGWSAQINADELSAVINFLLRWEEIEGAGLEMPVVETPPLDMSPERIAQGSMLFDLVCVQCHGVDAFGSPMAPALNNQQFLNDTSDGAIQQIITLGVPGTVMPSWAGYLTEDDIVSIVAYLRSLEATAPPIVNPQ